jgi:AMMECR1 domain-containing protein
MPFFKRENKKQLKTIFDWLSGAVNQNDIILLEQKNRRAAWHFEFPLKLGDKPKKIKISGNDDFAFYIKFSAKNFVPENEKWLPIFQSDNLNIFENKKIFQSERSMALRWGLGADMKKTALRLARKSLEFLLTKKRYPKTGELGISLPETFQLKTDVGVALWVGGILRGSAIVENRNLGSGIVEAAIYAARDARFKPIKIEELPLTKIEITLISDLKIPIDKNFIARNEILYDKGYLLKRDGKKGWLLPEIFNVAKFKNLKEFLFRLASEKASLSAETIFDKKTEIYFFEIEDFIEGKKVEEFLELDGPFGKPKKTADIEETAILAADWLLKIQEPDGNFPPIINPASGVASQIDWPRCAFSGWSLVEFGRATGKSVYIEAGRKAFFYLKNYLLKQHILSDQNKASLVLAYLGQLALSLNSWEDAKQCGFEIINSENLLIYEPVLFSQIGSFFVELAKIDMSYFEAVLHLARQSQQRFDAALHNGAEMNLAGWAELVNLNTKLFFASRERTYLDAAGKIADWLLRYQLGSGAFASSTKSNFVYTRGTGKIAEVLAALMSPTLIDAKLDINYYRVCLQKTFEWLAAMQYRSENSYFIPGKNLKNTIGGFRHDYFNFDCWIDSAAHYLLAASRYLASVTTKNL